MSPTILPFLHLPCISEALPSTRWFSRWLVLSSYAYLDSDLKFQHNICLLLILSPSLHILWPFFRKGLLGIAQRSLPCYRMTTVRISLGVNKQTLCCIHFISFFQLLYAYIQSQRSMILQSDKGTRECLIH